MNGNFKVKFLPVWLWVLGLIMMVPAAFANEEYNGSIKGKVLTSDGASAPFVTITLKNTSISTIADEEGEFVLKNIKPGNYTVIATFSGWEAQENTVNVAEGASKMIITMEQSAKQMQEVIIEGRRSNNSVPVAIGKLPIAPMDLPQSVAVIGQNIMREQQTQKLSDVIKNVNGMYVSTTRASTQETFAARGYRLSGDNFFKNGSRINSGVIPEMSSLEKVEILKGNAAILFGSVAPGGIVNMVTKQPKFEQGGEVSLRAGSFQLYKPTADIYGPISSKVAYRINGTFEDAASFRDKVHSTKYYVNPSLLFKFNDRTSLLVQADYLNHDYTPDFGLGSLDGNKIADIPRHIFHGADWQYNKVVQSTAGVVLKHKLNDIWSLNMAASYQYYNRDYYAIERIQADAKGDWARPLGKSQSNEDYGDAQINLTGKFKWAGLQHTILAGVDGDTKETITYAFDNPKIYDSLNILDHSKFKPRTDIPEASKTTRATVPQTRIGAYIQDLISVSNKIKVLAGVRWSKLYSGDNASYNYAKDTTTFVAGKNEAAFSQRLGIVYKPVATTSVFASYSNSFLVNTGMTVDSAALKPSIVDQFELGVKNDFFNGQLSINLTAYRIVNNNLAQMAPFLKDGVTPNNLSTIKELTGQTTSDGIELDIVGHPAIGLDIMAGYSYNHMRYTKTSGEKGSYIEGEKLVGNPDHTANASIFYTFNKTKIKGLKLGVSGLYTGARIAGWNNTNPGKGLPMAASRMIPVNAFTTIDISAGYTYKQVSLIAKVSNVTNAYNYYVHENYSINPIPPTQWMATVAYKF